MARYKMDDGTIVDTDNASKEWKPSQYWDGHNNIDVNTGSQWVDQYLYRSRKGRYYTVTKSRMEGCQDHAEWISNHEAARWLLLNEEEVPEELASFADEVSE